MRTILALAAAATLAIGCSNAGPSDNTLRFSAIPGESKTEMKHKFEPVARHLSNVLGVHVAYVAAADYQASVEMFKNGDIQLAWFGGLTGVQARHAVPGARAIVQGKEDTEYYSYFVAHASTGLERSDSFPAAIANLPFTFGSESSTSGRLMPEFFIRQEGGKPPKEFFRTPPAFSGSHPNTANAVAEGTKIKAGAMSYTTYDQMVKEGRIDPAVCRIVWKTPPYADYNFTAHPDLESKFGAGFTDKLRQALIDIDDPELLAAFQRSALIPATTGEFDKVKRVAQELGLLR